jgi:hypothetical protein
MCNHMLLLNHGVSYKQLKSSGPVSKTFSQWYIPVEKNQTGFWLSIPICSAVLHIFAYDIPESLIPNMQNKIKLIK